MNNVRIVMVQVLNHQVMCKHVQDVVVQAKLDNNNVQLLEHM